MPKHVELYLHGEVETLDFGKHLARVAESGNIFFLQGDLGAGKTTLVRGFLQELGHDGPVKSPTYTLVEHYTYANKHIYHFDLYRLGDPEELEYMGMRDYLGPRNICLIEWAERGTGFLPEPELNIHLHYEDAGHRRCVIDAVSKDGVRLLQHLVDLFGLHHASPMKIK